MEKLLGGGVFFEGPRWHDGYWYVSDLYMSQVLRVSVDGVAEQVLEVPNQPSGLGWLPDGSLVVVSMKDRRLLRRLSDGTITEHADLSALSPYYINDMAVDGQGRAYVGTFGFDLFAGGKPEPGAIVRVDPDGSAHIAASDLRFPNGMVVTPDDNTLIVAECFGGRFTAFDIEAGGALSGRREWAKLADAPSYESVETIVATDFAPDGCALDADGHIWVADALNGRVCRVAPGGEITDELRPPGDLGLYACALGGHDGHTLLVCTAPSFAEHERKAAKEAELYIHRVDVPRAEAPR